MQLTMGQSNYSIRALIRHVGLVAAILVAIATPAIYWVVVTHHQEKAIDFKIQQSAERSARYIASNDKLWINQPMRLGEIIDYGEAVSAELRQRVVNVDGVTVVEIGARLADPLLKVSKPIVVRGETVGFVEGEISLFRSLVQTGIVAVFAAILGFGAYVFLRIVPLRALDRAVERLKTATDETAEANRQLAMKIRELETLNEQLETIVKNRTAEAEAAADEARQANKVKSAFLASMSHEIRTPMNGVLGMAELLSRTDLTAHQKRLVSTINQSTQTLLTIINDILDHSRIESGNIDLDDDAYDLRATIEGSIEILAQDAERKGLEISLLVPPELPEHVVGDAGRLRQVLVNLIGNAIKFTKQGQIAVRLADLGGDDQRRRIQFLVSDTGIGIGPEALKNLFNPFTQADATITRRFGGTGLGLSISQSLVRMMGGDIALTSEVGKGTTVTFDIAVAIDAHATRPKSAQALDGMRVLVVDRQEMNRDVLCRYLSEAGAQLETADSGHEAFARLIVAAAQEAPFDLTVIDMAMPETNGFELARRIKSDPDLAQTKLVMTTPAGWKGDMRAGRDIGIEAFLTKPVRQDDLVAAVSACLPATAGHSIPKAAPATAAATVEAATGPLRLLLAEDNPINQEVLRGYAVSLGCSVVIAENGRQAVELFKSGAFDLVLMDCQMPDMDGLSACKAIRSLEAERCAARTPIIAITANAYHSDRVICLEAGMDDVLTKPCTLVMLSDAIRRWAPTAPVAAPPPRQGAARTDGEETSGILDTSTIQSLDELQSGAATRLVDLYLATAPRTARQIMVGLVEGDHGRIAFAAHSLKSSSATIGANRVAELARTIEIGAKGKASFDGLLQLGSQLETALCHTEHALRETDWGALKRAS